MQKFSCLLLIPHDKRNELIFDGDGTLCRKCASLPTFSMCSISQLNKPMIVSEVYLYTNNNNARSSGGRRTTRLLQ